MLESRETPDLASQGEAGSSAALFREDAFVSTPEHTPTRGKHAKNRTTEDQRIAMLANDPTVKEFASTHVVCKLCDKRVALYGYAHYLQPWKNHKAACPNAKDAG
jgi:hypothetical protein